MKDILMKDLQSTACSDIMQVLGVPPVVSSSSEKTRFDSAAEEIEVFYFNTLTPMLELVSITLQKQLVEQGAWVADAVTKEVSISKEIQKAFDSTQREGITLILDPTTLPIWTKVEEGRFRIAAKAKFDFHLSSREASDKFDLDLPLNEHSDVVYIPTNLTDMAEDPNPGGSLQPSDDVAQPTAETEPNTEEEPDEAPEEEAEKTAEQIELEKKYAAILKKKFFEIRRHIVSGGKFTLKELDSINDQSDPILKIEIRKIYALVKPFHQDRDAVKRFFNKITRTYCRELASLTCK
jgi:hypothetical protein